MADYGLQYTFRQGEVMINVPIEERDPDLIGNEITDKLTVVQDHASLSAAVQAELNATGAAAGVLGARPVSSGPAAGGPAQNKPAFGAGSGPECPHGARIWKEGESRTTGNPYKGWFCPSQAPGCKPLFK